MRFEIENGSFVGTAEWQGPGNVALEVEDPKQKQFFERFFETEHEALGGPVDCPGFYTERADTSEESFERAMNSLAAYAYQVRRADSSRTARAHRERRMTEA